MKRWTWPLMIACLMVLFFTVFARCAEPEPSADGEKHIKDPAQLFYNANAFYEKGEYAKAIEEYLKVLGAGLESGNLYYNIGNGFFKLNKLGYAIYCYEKAKRLMPGDSDLKSNLSYARSLTGTADYPESAVRAVLRRLIYPMRQVNLDTAAVLTASAYCLAVLVSALFIRNRILVKRYGAALYIVIAVCLYCLIAFGLRYFHEVVIKFGIVVERGVECKYEPIDKSTTYFTLPEGDKAVIIKTRNGWRQIRSLDGKAGWVPKDSVQEI